MSQRSGGSSPATGIEECAVAQHGAGDGQQPVCDRAQGAAVGVAALAQGAVLGPADGIVLDGHPAPVIDGVYQAALAGPSADYAPYFAGSSGDRCDAG